MTMEFKARIILSLMVYIEYRMHEWVNNFLKYIHRWERRRSLVRTVATVL